MFLEICRKPLHASWLVAVFCFGIVVGVMASPQGLRLSVWPWLLVVGMLVAGGLFKRKVYTVLLLVVAGLVLGLIRGGVYQRELAPYESVIGEYLILQGNVLDDSDVGKRGEVVLRLGDIQIGDTPLAGGVWVSLSGKADIKRGDRVVVKGKLTEGFGSFAASMYRAELEKVQRPVPGNIALTVRDWFADAVRQAIPEPEASLGVGYVVGQRRALPEELDDALRVAGLTHVVVASGYNLTILVSMARRLFAKVSKFLAAFFSGGLTVAFVAITGMSPSMSRAGLVTALGLLAWYYGRRFHPVVLLLLAAAVTLCFTPAYAQNDLGWQLSFASFAGVLMVGPLLYNYFYGKERPNALRQVFFETMSAWVCTVPLIIVAFGQISNVAILANMLVLPLIPLAMLLTFIAGVVTIALPPLAAVAGFPAGLLLGYMTKVTTFLGNMSWAQTDIEAVWYFLPLYYGVLILICGYIWRKTRFDFMERPQLE